MNDTFVAYLIYLAVTVPLVVFVARTLHRHGALFLREVFHGNDGLAGLFELGAGKLETRYTDEVYGFPATTIHVAQYRLACVHSQLFDLVGEPLSSMMIGLDLANVTNWYMNGEGKMQLKRNTNDVASKEGETISHMWRVHEGVTLNVLERHWAIEALA